MDLKSLIPSWRTLAALVAALAAGQSAVPTALANTAPVFITPVGSMPQLYKTGVNPMTEDETLTIAVNVGAGSSDTRLLENLSIDDTEEDNEDIGIAITEWGGNGSLQYLNTSSAWVAIPVVTAAQPFLLGPTHRLRYVGDTENAETASFTYYLWDGTEGTARATFTIPGGIIGGATAFSSATRTSSIPVSAVQDPAQLNNVPATFDGDDNAEVEAFAAVTVDDVDRSPADTLTVRVTVAQVANGSLSQKGSHGSAAFSETSLNSGIYTSTGSEAAVEAALQDLVFQPAPNIVAVGLITSTNIQLTVSDNQPGPAVDDTESMVIRVESINDNPVVTPDTADRFVFTRGSIIPFVGFTVNDADVGTVAGRQSVSLSITETFALAEGSFLLANGSIASGTTTSTTKTITFAAQSIEAALAELVGLRYVASAVTLAVPETVTLTLVVTDEAGGTATATIDVVVATPNISSNIRGTESDQTILDTGVRRLFENVTITGTNVAVLEVVAEVATGPLATQNAVTAGVGNFLQTGPTSPFSLVSGAMRFDGTASDAASALNFLAFKPVPNMFGQVDTVQFKLTLKDATGAVLGTDSQTTAAIVPVNDLPTFIRFQILSPILDSATAIPFQTVEIGDADVQGTQQLRVTIEIRSSLPAGTTAEPVPGSLAGTTIPGFVETPADSGIYLFTGTPLQATAAINGLVFTPEKNRLQPGMNEMVTFRVSLDDSSGDIVVRDQVKVLVISENDTPVVTDAPNGRIEVMDGNDITPFGDAGTSLEDEDLNESVTVRIQLDSAAKGQLVDSLGRFLESPDGSGIYLASGAAADVEEALQGLQFELKPGYPVPAGEPGITVEFLVTITDRQAAKVEFSFTLLVRVNQVTRVVTNTDDSGPGSLRQAIDEASDNDHVAFDLDAVFATQLSAVIRLQSPLIIDKNLTIVGPGSEKLVISGDSDEDGVADVQLFQVGLRDFDGSLLESAYLHLSYVTLADGSDEASEFGNGGAVSVGPGSTLVLDHAEVLNCVAEQWGGAIDVDDGRLSVSHSLFAGNATGVNLGQGGGAISVYSNGQCSISDVTFSGNVQRGASGIGGGALYFENAIPVLPFDVSVRQCTFEDNADVAGKGSSIRTNVFNTVVALQNCLFSDGDPNPLDPSGAGRIISLGGNVADDDAQVWISQGGESLALFLLDDQSDRISQELPLEPLADNGGQTRTHALPVGSPARIAGLLGSGTPTDQRDVVRAATPSAGAFEASSFIRFVINEIHFDPAAATSAFIELVNPRDSQTADVGDYEIWVSGVKRHVFSPQLLAPGTAVLVSGGGLPIVPTPPGGFPVQPASVSGGLALGLSGGIVELRAPDPDAAGPLSGGVVATATYLARFEESGAPGTELRAAYQSVTRSCEFLGGLIPQGGDLMPPRLVTPGEDITGTPLLEGNAPPVAYDDSVDTDEDTVIRIDVLANDFDADRTDVIRVESLPLALSANGAALSILNDPRTGAAIGYDPTDPVVAAAIQAIPLGGELTDFFDYVILDYANGTTANSRVRVPPGLPGEEADNILRATGRVTLRITGINDAPEPADDKPVTLPWLATTEDTVLTFLADTLLDNDTDPDTAEGGRALRICWVKPPNFALGDKDPTRVELSDLETETALGARVMLTLRADRNLSSVSYNPQGSAILNALAQGEVVEDSFTYLVIDQHGAPGIATVCIQVTGVNDTPVARDDGPFATHEDAPVDILFVPDVLGNDTDVDQNGVPPDDVLAVLSSDGVSLLGAAITRPSTGPGRFSYNPVASALLQQLSKKEVVTDQFDYVVTDPHGATSTATIFVSVTGMNDKPTASDDTALADEDGPVSIAASDGLLGNDGDVDMNDAIPDDILRTVAGTFTTTLNATVILYSDGSFDYQPNGLFEGLGLGESAVDSFDYTVTDDSLVYASGDAYRVAAGETGVFLPVLMNDVNLGIDVSGPLVVTQADTPSQGGTVLVAPGGSGVLYTPAFGFVGRETFTYHIAAGTNGFCMAEVTVEVVPASGPIVGKNDVFTVAPFGTAILDVLANDVSLPGGTALALTHVSATSAGGTASIVFNGGRTVIRYEAPAPQASSFEDTFAYEATAGGGTTFSSSVTIKVPARAGLLRARDDSFFVVSDTEGNELRLLANDGVLPSTAAGWSIDPAQLGAPVAVSGTTVLGGGTVDVSDDRQRVLYTPAAGFSGVVTFTYGVIDAFGGTGAATVTVSVGPQGFRAMDDSFAVNWNSGPNTLPVLANDVLLPNNGETIQITFLSALSIPSSGSIAWNESRSAVVYTPSPGFAGPVSFTYEIGTASHPRQAATVRINVINRSGEILGANDTYCVAGDSRVNVLRVLANDGVLALGSTPLVVTAVGVADEGGTVDIEPASGFLFYTPAPGFIGTETFTYEFSDGRGGTGAASVTVMVGEIFAGNDFFTVVSGTTLSFLDVLANDRRIPGDRPELVGVTVAPSAGGTVALNGAGDALLYTPASPTFTGIETFAYSVTNDTGETTQAVVMVRVLPADSDHDDARVFVTVRGANDAPTLSGVEAIDFLRDDHVVKPFANVLIGEVDSYGLQPLTIQVIIDDPEKGELVPLVNDPALLFLESPPGTYTFIGTAANATLAIRNLCFVPTDNRIEWSKHETTTLTICISDGIAPEIKDSGTTIEVYNIGQLFADNWIFGNGITMSWNDRRQLSIGLREPFGLPLGGGGTWSDPYTGQWLLYTDGVTAWNAQTGAPITGAIGTLGGSVGEANMIPAMVVAKPGGDPSVNLFVLAFGSTSRNIHLTEINMTTGAVVGAAGRPIIGTSPSQQGWVLVPHDNGNDYWLIIGNGSAYPITAAGAGTPVTNFNLDGSGASFRYSPDRRRIAVGWSSPKMYIYDFNPGTGVFTTSRIELPRGDVFFEFSHDGKKLYVNDTRAPGLYQYDLSADPGPAATTAARTAAVAATELLLHTYTSPDFAGDMALAPDGRIYIAGEIAAIPKLHVVNEPNALGVACDLVLDAVALPPGSTLRQGLYHGLRTDDLIRSAPPPPGPFEAGRIAAVTTATVADVWTTVTLDRVFTSMVVVATVEYPNAVPGAVMTRVRNATGNSFEVSLAHASGATTPITLPVHYLVAEAGQYTTVADGIKMEAVRYDSTVTDRRGSFSGQSRPYLNSYTSPVVIGQVMTSNDPRPSVFWARGNNSSNPPSSGFLSTGKHVGADTFTTRVTETIGHIVIEAGQGTVRGIDYRAFTGTDSVKGISDSPPYSYTLTGVPNPKAAALSSAAMDNPDGGWPVLFGPSPLTATNIGLAINEDQYADPERGLLSEHEQVAVLVVGNATAVGPLAVAAASLDQWRQLHFSPELLADPAAESTHWGLEADAEGDGRTNIEEYAFGSDPWHLDDPDPVRVWIDHTGLTGSPQTLLSYVRRTQDTLLRYTVEVSPDLNQWSLASTRPLRTTSIAGSGYEAVTLILDAPSAPPSGFYRVRAVR